MAKTRQEICIIAAEELGVTPVSQAAPGGQFGVIERKFDVILADLQAREIVSWGTNETPDDCANALAVYLACKCVNALPSAPEVRQYFRDMGEKPYRDLIAVAGRRWTGASYTTSDRF